MTISFKLSERIGLLGVLERQGNLSTLRLLNEVFDVLPLDDDEQKSIVSESDPDIVDPRKLDDNDVERQFDISEHALTMIKDRLKKLEDDSELPIGLLSVWDKLFDEV